MKCVPDKKSKIDALFDRFTPFIKIEKPVQLEAKQKVILNRKANELFNSGKISEAERIYKATGYSDGLSRVGEVYEKRGEIVKALEYYVLAHNSRKTPEAACKVAKVISKILK